MTYLQFLLVFLIPPILILGLVLNRVSSLALRAALKRIGLMAVIAVVYTTPWDNYLIAIGAWTYPPNAVIGTIGLVPVEEYLFFILQPFATGLLFEFMRRQRALEEVERSLSVAGVTAGLGMIALGSYLLVTGLSIYMGLILVWSGPVILLQWVYNGAVLSRNSAAWLTPLIISTVYLWIADGIAIRLGIWSIAESKTIGWAVLGLPIEEMTFFFVTNAMVLFGIILFENSMGDQPRQRQGADSN